MKYLKLTSWSFVKKSQRNVISTKEKKKKKK